MGFASHAAAVSAHLKGLSLLDLKHILTNKHIIFPSHYKKEDETTLNVVVDVSVIFYWESRSGDSAEKLASCASRFLSLQQRTQNPIRHARIGKRHTSYFVVFQDCRRIC